jgi:hypothetical protein
MRASFAALTAVLLLAGCGSDEPGADKGATISRKYGADVPNAAETAAKECAAYGRTAKPHLADPDSQTKEQVFDCL